MLTFNINKALEDITLKRKHLREMAIYAHAYCLGLTDAGLKPDNPLYNDASIQARELSRTLEELYNDPLELPFWKYVKYEPEDGGM